MNSASRGREIRRRADTVQTASSQLGASASGPSSLAPMEPRVPDQRPWLLPGRLRQQGGNLSNLFMPTVRAPMKVIWVVEVKSQRLPFSVHLRGFRYGSGVLRAAYEASVTWGLSTRAHRGVVVKQSVSFHCVYFTESSAQRPEIKFSVSVWGLGAEAQVCTPALPGALTPSLGFPPQCCRLPASPLPRPAKEVAPREYMCGLNSRMESDLEAYTAGCSK